MSIPQRVFAAVYDRSMQAAEAAYLAPLRAQLLGGLSGQVIEVGAGTGANLAHYPPGCALTLVEPSSPMRRRLAAKAARLRPGARISAATAEELPAAGGSVDAVVFTLVLCSVPDQARALAEARRVLKPGGRLVFLEHVRGQGRHARWQDRLAPLSRAVNAGCSPNRDTLAAVEAAGFILAVPDRLIVKPEWILVNPFVFGSAAAPGHVI